MTRYLGIADWYSLHYLATCQGYFGVDTSSGLLTSDKVNVTCVEQGLGYTFSLLDTVSPQLNPSVAGVTSDIPADLPPFETKPEAALLTLGIIWSGVEIALLVLTIRGILHLNISSFIVSSVLQPPHHSPFRHGGSSSTSPTPHPPVENRIAN